MASQSNTETNIDPKRNIRRDLTVQHDISAGRQVSGMVEALLRMVPYAFDPHTMYCTLYREGIVMRQTLGMLPGGEEWIDSIYHVVCHYWVENTRLLDTVPIFA
jgi:hypothetical protein